MLKKPSAKRAQYTGLLHGARRARKARPDSAELDVFLGQHILFTLEQHFNSNILS